MSFSLKRNILQTVAFVVMTLLATFSLAAVFTPGRALAASPPCKKGQTPANTKCVINICKVGQDPGKDNCINQQDYIACDPDPALGSACQKSGSSTTTTTANKCNKDCIITRYVNPLINFLSIIFGLIVTITIASGGVMYTTSGGDPQKAAKAKARIGGGIGALAAFVFLWVFLQWIIPGGLFS